MRRLLPVLVTALALAACSSAPPAAPAPAPSARAESALGVEQAPFPRAAGATDLHLGESYTWPSGDTVVVRAPLPLRAAGAGGPRLVRITVEVTNGGGAAQAASAFRVEATADGRPVQPVAVAGLPGPSGTIAPLASSTWALALPAATAQPATFVVAVAGGGGKQANQRVTFTGTG